MIAVGVVIAAVLVVGVVWLLWVNGIFEQSGTPASWLSEQDLPPSITQMMAQDTRTFQAPAAKGFNRKLRAVNGDTSTTPPKSAAYEAASMSHKDYTEPAFPPGIAPGSGKHGPTCECIACVNASIVIADGRGRWVTPTWVGPSTPAQDTGNAASESLRTRVEPIAGASAMSVLKELVAQGLPPGYPFESCGAGIVQPTSLRYFALSIRITQVSGDGFEFESCRRSVLECVDVIQQSRMLADAIEDALGTIHEGDGAITSLFVGILPKVAK